jgi:hypothetical protein
MTTNQIAGEALVSTLTNKKKLSDKQFLARLNALTIKFNRKFGEPGRFGSGAKKGNKK